MTIVIAILAGVCLLLVGVVLTLVGMVREQQRWVQRNYNTIEPVAWDYVRDDSEP